MGDFLSCPKRRAAIAGVTMMLALSACGEQGARPATLAAPLAAAQEASGGRMEDGAQALAPQGWLDFCARTPADPSCRAAELTPARAQQLESVQAMVRRIPARTDQQLYGVAEFWRIADNRSGGDCEDVALAAREQLLAQGWPLSALRLATAWTEHNEYHLVLTVDVRLADKVHTLVIDNRYPRVQTYGALVDIGYRFQTRQAATGAGWVRVRDPSLPRTEMASASAPSPATITAAVEPAVDSPAAMPVAGVPAPVRLAALDATGPALIPATYSSALAPMPAVASFAELARGGETLAYFNFASRPYAGALQIGARLHFN